MIAENHYDPYDGLLLVGPALSERFFQMAKLQLNHKPMVPILYLTTQDEVEPVQTYLEKLDKNGVIPAFWIVKRLGHLNVSSDEELFAFRALVDYADNKRIPMKKDIVLLSDYTASTAVFKDGGAYTKVAEIQKEGNIDTEFIVSDVERLGIKRGGKFTVTFGGNAYRVHLGLVYSDVPKGEWIAFFRSDGKLRIARNYESAVKLLGCAVGDMVLISLEDPSASFHP